MKIHCLFLINQLLLVLLLLNSVAASKASIRGHKIRDSNDIRYITQPKRFNNVYSYFKEIINQDNYELMIDYIDRNNNNIEYDKTAVYELLGLKGVDKPKLNSLRAVLHRSNSWIFNELYNNKCINYRELYLLANKDDHERSTATFLIELKKEYQDNGCGIYLLEDLISLKENDIDNYNDISEISEINPTKVLQKIDFRNLTLDQALCLQEIVDASDNQHIKGILNEIMSEWWPGWVCKI